MGHREYTQSHFYGRINTDMENTVQLAYGDVRLYPS